MRTPTITLAPIGTAYPALAIPGVGQIRGVLIDNPSGAWLLLRPTNDYIPPYTLGFARSFVGGVASVDVSYQSPAGQVSTLAGDPATIILDTEPVPDSSGSSSGTPFVGGFTPNLYASVSGSSQAGTILATLIAGIAGKRIRLMTLNVNGYVIGGGANGGDGTFVFGFISAGSTSFNIQGVIDTMRGLTTQTFELGGLDMQAGSAVQYSISSNGWLSSMFYAVSASYQVI